MTSRQLLGWAGEAALIGLTVVVTLGMERLFLDTSFLRDALALAVASHLVAIAARRAGLGMAAAGVLSCAAAVATVTVLLYADTANVILPTSETLDLLRIDLTEGWTVFSDDRAPVPVVPGFVVAIGALLWTCAFLADWAAFRLRSPIEAVAPASVVFVFTALLGAEDNQILHASLFAAAVAATMLTMRVNRQVREEVWIERRAGGGAGATLRMGMVAGSFAVVAGAVFGPTLPGAGDPALVDVTELDSGPKTRVVVSPLVQVQATIVDQAEIEIFSVEVAPDGEDYWRMMSLDEFDGDLWKASSNFEPAAGAVSTDLDASVLTRSVRQTFTTTALGNIYLPVAYELAEVISDGGIALEYETESAALVVTRESYTESQNGFTYTVESRVPLNDGPRLRVAPQDSLDSDFVDHYTKVPRDLPDTIKAEAERITAGATSDYDRALALQNHLQGFTYNINVASTHDVNSLETFLFEVKEGYCEQFASAFAAMARSVGIPTRLAVGFTWGEWDPSRGVWVVRGEHAHAWPEVYFASTGWVKFEPTPGRGGPHDSAVTGRQPQQAGSAPTVPTTTVVPGAVAPATGLDRPFEEFPGDTTTNTPGASSGDESNFPFLTLALAMLSIAVVLAVVPGLRLLQRRHRAARVAHDPKGRIELAWDDALEALELVDIRHQPHETPAEFADRVDGRRNDLGRMVSLAENATSARYSRAVEDASVSEAEASLAEIRAVCHRSTPRGRRALTLFDPRPLVRSK